MDPELGRFISLDPELGSLSFPQTTNRYVYCVNNPLKYRDSTGQWLHIAVGALIGAVASGVLYGVEVALTDKTWDWEEFGAEVVSGAIGGAVAGLLMNPQAGLAVKAGAKAAMLGGKALSKVAPSLAGRALASKAAPYAPKMIAGALSGMASSPISYSVKYGLDVGRGADPRLSWQEFVRGFAESSLFGGVGGGLGAAAGKLFGGSRLGSYLGKNLDTAFGSMGISDSLGRFSLSGTVIGETFVSRLTSKGIARVLDNVFVIEPSNRVATMPTYATG
jgi:hypothetical protein